MKKRMVLALALLSFFALAFTACTESQNTDLPEETERHTATVADVAGLWRSPPNPEVGYEEITLNPDGTFIWQSDGRIYGTFTFLDGDILMLTGTQLVSRELGGVAEDIAETRELTFDRENQRLIPGEDYGLYFERLYG